MNTDPVSRSASFDAHLRTVTSNAPGLVFQLLLQPDASLTFTYLSEGCMSVLGLRIEQLREQAAQLLQIIEPDDRSSYLESMQASARELVSWNWEGRIQIEGWDDIKWINLRATPVALPGTGIQWNGLMTNITRSKLAELEILRSRRQLAELSAHVQLVKEEERTRIAREIHDDLGGNLTAIKMALSQLVKTLPDDDALRSADLMEKAAYVDSLVDRTIEATHRIARDLRPGILDLGVVAAVRWQAQEFRKQTGVSCEVLAAEEEFDVTKQQANVLFRIFQEALTNIAKHAQASKVDVRLQQSDGLLHLAVADNGIGIADADQLKPNSFGIRGMKERIAAMGGSLEVDAQAGGGCRVCARLPLGDSSN